MRIPSRDLSGYKLTYRFSRARLRPRRCFMRCLLKVSIPVEAGNTAISDGSLPTTIESSLADLKPEAAYFAEDNGKRTGFIFFDLKDPSQIPAVAEPWFLAFNAHVELRPAMNLEDLKKAGPGIDKAVKNYRRIAQAKAA